MSAAGDTWRPSASLAILRLRAALLCQLRGWFAARNILEVETPALSQAATTDANLHSMGVTVCGEPRFLHTSPEFPMKRLLAAGSGDIYQVARVFRDGETGRLHGPEFTMLEWYRIGMSLDGLMDEVESLITSLAAGHRTVPAGLRMTYRQAFLHYAGVDPITATPAELVDALCAAGVEPPAGAVDEPRSLRDLLLATVVEPCFDPLRPTFIHGFPEDQAALARLGPGCPPLAARFELFLGGMEIANGFDELTDAAELRRRCETDLSERRRQGLAMMPLDEHLQAAQDAGLPACSGVALGFDRLVMWISGLPSFSDVVCFDAQRA